MQSLFLVKKTIGSTSFLLSCVRQYRSTLSWRLLRSLCFLYTMLLILFFNAQKIFFCQCFILPSSGSGLFSLPSMDIIWIRIVPSLEVIETIGLTFILSCQVLHPLLLPNVLLLF